MEVLLIEKHQNLGNIGTIVNVTPGYARNYLLPKKIAIRATFDNKQLFAEQRKDIEKAFELKKQDALKKQTALTGKHIFVIKQAGEDGKLYGSVGASELARAVKDQLKVELLKTNVVITDTIKYLGSYRITVALVADVTVLLHVMVARSQEEGEVALAKETASVAEASVTHESTPAEEEKSKKRSKAKASEESLEEIDSELEEEPELELNDNSTEPVAKKTKAKPAKK
jgi:large subunit ribosomal protein L9